MIKATPAPPPEPPSRGGIPAQIRKLNERIEQLEQSLAALQRVIDDEVMPASQIATAKAEAALEEVSKVATAKLGSRPPPKPKKSRSR